MTPAAPRGPAWTVWACSAWLATAANLPLWRELYRLGLLDSAGGWLIAAALGAVLASAIAGLTSLFAWRWTLKPWLALLLTAAAAGAYFMLAYGVVIDGGMLQNVLQTDRHEAGALLSPWFAASWLLLAGVPTWLLVRQPIAFAGWKRQGLRNGGAALLALALVSAIILACFQPLASAMRNHKQLRYLLNPLNSVYALAVNVPQPWKRDRSKLEPVGLDAQAATVTGKPPLLVLVLGETGRSGNFSVNGYARDTTPELAREGVASWRNAWACGTSTAASVPCMFSPLGREAFDDRPHEYETVLDVVQRAGLAVLWVDNQSGCKGVCDRVPNARTSAALTPALCKGEECEDAALVEGLDARIAALPAERRKRGVLLVLHQMGSHGPAYSQRSPAAFKRFLPECESVQLQDCSRDALRNAYDNSIAYTDHVLGSTIRWLKKRDDYAGAMVYVADHGESLGENNIYLHGLPYAIAPEVQKHVPWVTWLSPAFQKGSGIAMECLRADLDTRISHDHYFHSVLGLLHIGTAAYQRSLDAYARCDTTDSSAAGTLAAWRRPPTLQKPAGG